MNDLGPTILAFFLGAAGLTGVLAIGARVAFKPILESRLRLRGTAFAEEVGSLQDRRIELLEQEIGKLQRTVGRLAEAEEFRSQLEDRRSSPQRITALTGVSDAE
ncbi:MAG: hypothetical protein WD737_06245 [Gemmatimonadota bacterium]